MKSLPEDFSATELVSLDQLASELRALTPEPALSEGFHETLAARLRLGWSFRSALDRSPLIRVAAGLLMISLIAAPVAAIVTLLRPIQKAPPTLGFEALPDFTDADRSSWAAEEGGGGYVIIGPEDDFAVPRIPWSSSRIHALEQSNRLALAAASLTSTYEELLPAGGEPSPLWARFLQVCFQGSSDTPDALLSEPLVEYSEDELRDPSTRTARAAWHWVLTGETSTSAEAPLAWDGAPFVGSDD